MHNVMYFMTEGMFTLTRNGAEIYFWCFWFQTPLHIAAYNGKGDVVEILVRNGANINEKNVQNISVGETEDFENVRESRERERERERAKRGSSEKKKAERGSLERGRGQREGEREIGKEPCVFVCVRERETDGEG
jgi:hypothetical protein